MKILFTIILVMFYFSGASSAHAVDLLPNGSYQQSCTNCSYNAGSQTLSCSCTTGGDNDCIGCQESTSLWVGDCTGDIGNNGGELSCSSGPSNMGPDVLPEGSYRGSCENCSYSVESQTLSCSCTTGGDNDCIGCQQSTSLWVGECSGDIENNGGELSCQ